MQKIGVLTGCLTLYVLVTGFLISCSESDKTTTVNFMPILNNQPISCEPMQGKGNAWGVGQFWFYLSDLQVMNDKQWTVISLPNNNWQQNNIALIGMHCRDNKQANVALQLPAFNDDVKSLKFTIGLPVNINHQNPLTATGIFNNANMFWTWQQGYKGLRLDLNNESGDNWAYHIGAVGCQSSSSLRAPTTPCRQTNQVDIVIDNIKDNIPIIIDLSRVVAGVDIGLHSRCLSLPTQASCQKLMTNMVNKHSPVMYQQASQHD